jgi:hypothetical protein
MINREIEAYQANKYYEAGDTIDEQRVEEFLASAQENGFDVGGGRGGPEILAGDTGTGGKAGGDAGGDIAQKGSAELERVTDRSFDGRMAGLDDPHSLESRAVIDGMIHDLQMLTELDPTATFRLSDDGPEQGIADVLAELNVTKNEIAALKTCMLPKGRG